ncbi:MAG TPA: SPOR domain-containing protein [Burkholderiales bacterium]|nr:SPOR domain-containing protein [Burkholderiales bacterium]
MSRDYKSNPNAKPARGGSMFAGILIGLILGIGISLGVAWYINKLPSPFVIHGQQAEAKPGNIPPPDVNSGDATKPKFDFYKILPGQEPASANKPAPPETASNPPSTPAVESYYLQAGAFQKKDDADNMKAKLAMIGLESEIQGGGAESKYRVRIGPYQSQEEMNKTKDELRQNGIAVSIVKVKETNQ